jgi:predicted deacylase
MNNKQECLTHVAFLTKHNKALLTEIQASFDVAELDYASEEADYYAELLQEAVDFTNESLLTHYVVTIKLQGTVVDVYDSQASSGQEAIANVLRNDGKLYCYEVRATSFKPVASFRLTD